MPPAAAANATQQAQAAALPEKTGNATPPAPLANPSAPLRAPDPAVPTQTGNSNPPEQAGIASQPQAHPDPISPLSSESNGARTATTASPPGAIQTGAAAADALPAAIPQPGGTATTIKDADSNKAVADTEIAAPRPPAGTRIQDARGGRAPVSARTGTRFALGAGQPVTDPAACSAGSPAPEPPAKAAAAVPPIAATSGSAVTVPAERAASGAAAQHIPADGAAPHAVAAETPASPSRAAGSNTQQAPAPSGGQDQAEAAVPTVPPASPIGSAAPATVLQPAAGRPSDAATPAQQVVPALISLGRTQGSAHVTVRLDPQELGHLQIRVEQPKDGPARVTLTVERSQTLDLLVRDQAQLHRALDQAGVPADGRSVTFHLAANPLAAPTPDALADPSRSDPPAAAPGSSGASLASSDGGGTQHGPPRDGPASGQPRMAAGATDPQAPSPYAARWVRAGIDITA
jgi:flagellar hook-length control protein FliK